jgi:hypothetical protein
MSALKVTSGDLFFAAAEEVRVPELSTIGAFPLVRLAEGART